MRGNDQITRQSLLLRLRDARNAEAWEQFVEVYTPLIYGFCRQRGLQDADAADVSQEVMRAVANAIGRFECDRGRGRFRNWLLTVTRSKLNTFLARRQRQPRESGSTTIQQLLEAKPSPEDESSWDTAYHRRLFEVAAEQVRAEVQESTWQAFWKTACEEQDGQTVARQLGLSVGAVYIARSRVLARLKDRIRAIDGEAQGSLEDCM
jgi:RNA polymerase sigma-70 factor (ECF subfamily)